MFIVFEGPDGSGKTTQSKLLADFLKTAGHSVLWTREPGGSGLGMRIREILLEDKKIEVANKAELLLFAADRAQHVEKIIRPALDSGTVVICDRYTDSTIAYQCGGRGFDAEFVENINEYSTGALHPDLTILIDIDSETGLKRATTEQTDKFEAEKLSFHQNVRKKYLELANNNPNSHTIDGNNTVEDIFLQVQKLFQGIL